MKAKSILLIVFALGCGSVAAVGATQMLDGNKKSSKKTEVETVPVIVAAANIRAGLPFDENNVKIQNWPADRVPEGAMKTVKELDGQFSNQHLYKGEIILAAKVRSTQDGTALKIPKGMRVISIKVSTDESISGLLKPGDLVDVIVYLRKGADILEDTTRTILSKVTIFAVNSTTDRTVNEDGKPISAKTVSLLVSPKQSLVLMLADQRGSLHLSLRRPDDEESTLLTSDPEFNMRQLLGKQEELLPTEDNESPAFADWLHAKKEPEQERVVASVLEPAEQWKMVVMEGSGAVQVIEWSDTKKLPDHMANGVAAQAPAAERIEESPDLGAAEAVEGAENAEEQREGFEGFAEGELAK